ncbi:hypothetical protein HYV82_03800 [Candidatus Woesearchaeota archaeon]|nr:hypothetical protein [Candidatus Woesearchaeota archaeon]
MVGNSGGWQDLEGLFDDKPATQFQSAIPAVQAVGAYLRQALVGTGYVPQNVVGVGIGTSDYNGRHVLLTVYLTPRGLEESQQMPELYRRLVERVPAFLRLEDEVNQEPFLTVVTGMERRIIRLGGPLQENQRRLLLVYSSEINDVTF